MSTPQIFAVNNLDLKTSHVVRILPIPYDLTTSYRPGARFAPHAILEASPQLEMFDDSLGWDLTQHVKLMVEEEIEPDARGPEWMMQKISDIMKPLVRSGDFILSLGGEHSVSAPLIQEVHQKYPNLHVVQIDAHSDLRNQYQSSLHSHASVMRRVVDAGIPITQIGIRNLSEEEYQFFQTSPPVSLWKAEALKTPSIFQDLLTHLKSLEGPIYLTIDVDGLDPSIVPATGTPEPGGLMWYETMEILKTLGRHQKIVAADVMELAPSPGLEYANFAVAKLCYKMLTYIFHQHIVGNDS